MKPDRFRPVTHVPKYSKQLFETLQTPVVVYFGFVGNFVLCAGMASFYYFEEPVNPDVNTWLDTLWWGIATVTTVGYGDITPITPQGRITGLILILLGVAFFISFTALFVSVLFNQTTEEITAERRFSTQERKQILSQLTQMSEKIESIEKKLSTSD